MESESVCEQEREQRNHMADADTDTYTHRAYNSLLLCMFTLIWDGFYLLYDVCACVFFLPFSLGFIHFLPFMFTIRTILFCAVVVNYQLAVLYGTEKCLFLSIIKYSKHSILYVSGHKPYVAYIIDCCCTCIFFCM